MLQDMRRLHQIQSQNPDLPPIRHKHIKISGTNKPLILTPTHSLSVIGTTLGCFIFVAYIIAAVYSAYDFLLQGSTTPAYIVGISATVGLIFIYFASAIRLPFLMVILVTITGAIAFIQRELLTTLPFHLVALVFLGVALMFALSAYRMYKIKRGIWDRRIGSNRILGFYEDGIIGMLNKNKTDDDIAYKHKAEENTHEVLVAMAQKGNFYAFTDLPVPYQPDNYVDMALLSGTNLVITRSLLLKNGQHKIENFDDNSLLNVPNKSYAVEVRDYYKKLYPHLKVSFWFIAHPAEKPKEGESMKIESSTDKNIHFITVKDIGKLEKALYRAPFCFLFTKRHDIIQLNQSRQRATFTNLQKSEDRRFLKRF